MSNSNLFVRLLRYISPWKKSLVFSLCLILTARVIEAWIPIRLGLLAQDILTHEKEASHFIHEGLFLALLLVGQYFLDAIAVIVKGWVGSSGLVDLRKEVFSRILAQPFSFFDKERVGKLLTRTLNDVDQINQMFSESVLPLLGSLVMFVLIFIGMFWLDWRIAAVILCVLPFLLALTNYFRRIQREGYEAVRDEIQEMNSFVQEHLQGVITIRRFGLQKEEGMTFKKLNERLADANLETTKNFGFYISSNDFLQSVSYISAFVLLSYSSGFNAGIFFAFTLYIAMIFRPILDMAERYNILQSAFAAAGRIFSILELAPESKEGKTLEAIHTIEFKDVWFSYNGTDWALKGISFKIDPEERVGLIGKTGSGKSTVAALILRFYTPTKGAILINGEPIETFSPQSIRRASSVILQDPVIFTGTVEENVTLFDPTISAREAKKALDYVGFSERETIGEGSLSSGEKQLVSLARAAAHPGRFLIMDEATANIDPPTERKIEEALAKLTAGRGALIIAHRPSTIRGLDRVITLSLGKIVNPQ